MSSPKDEDDPKTKRQKIDNPNNKNNLVDIENGGERITITTTTPTNNQSENNNNNSNSGIIPSISINDLASIPTRRDSLFPSSENNSQNNNNNDNDSDSNNNSNTNRNNNSNNNNANNKVIRSTQMFEGKEILRFRYYYYYSYSYYCSNSLPVICSIFCRVLCIAATEHWR